MSKGSGGPFLVCIWKDSDLDSLGGGVFTSCIFCNDVPVVV
jgi:hypothetical protein